jgi:photosystem II stability/assembly factor-like uncharacterized protein
MPTGMFRRLVAATLFVLIAGTLTLSTAQEKSHSAESGPFKNLKYRLIGPAAGGRVSRSAGVPGNPLVYYAGTASGGVWKSSDGGYRWNPIFDKEPASSIGSLAVSPSNPNVVYVGTGEANIRGNVAPGNGIYKSVDAGRTWAHVWKQEGQIGTIVIHPSNPDIVFAAVLGHAFGPNPERGVYRTVNGGETWERVLFKNADTGASDVCFDPSNPGTLFAGLWQARRYPWGLASGGPGSGLYVSRDGGTTWKQITSEMGLPEGILGKIGVAVAPSDPRRVYALIEAEKEKGGLYRSDDGGDSWTLVHSGHGIRQRAFYYTTLTVDPANADVIWFPQVPMLRSLDGGYTVKKVKGFQHGDHHDLWIDPSDTRRMIDSNDGGVEISLDGGESWYAPPLPISQFYHVATDTREPYYVSGAMQDLGTAAGPSNSLGTGGIGLCDWYTVGGGEAGYTAHDPSDPDIVYAGEYGGYISRYDNRTKQVTNVSVYPDVISGHGAADQRYRFQWTAPILVSPHDPKTIYHGANVLFKTVDGGMTWSAISPDLTRNDKSKQQWSGGPITGDNSGAEYYDTIFALAESPLEKGLIWAGSDDGLVHITRDGGKTWKNVTANIPGLPEWGTVSMIEASPFDAGTAYVVVDAHRLDNMKSYIWKTSDYGATWKSLAAGLPRDVYLHAVREDPKRRAMLYVGSERGVSYSVDDGATWQPLQLNLPTVAVHDLQVKGDDLVLATHGRSIWILDDLTPIRSMSSQIEAEAAHLFKPMTSIRYRYHYTPRRPGSFDNPPPGVILNYFLKEMPKGAVKIEILDASGAVIRTLSSKPEEKESSEYDYEDEEEQKDILGTERGVDRGFWDLMYAGPTRIKNATLDEGNLREGPMAVPGTYTLRLVVDGREQTSRVTVEPDPRVKVSQADLESQFKLSQAICGAISGLAGDVNQIRSIRQQVESLAALLKGNSQAGKLIASVQDLVTKLDDLEAKLHNPKAEISYDIMAQPGGAMLYSKLSSLLATVQSSDTRPTQGMTEMFGEYRRHLDGLSKDLQALVAGPVSTINQTARDLKLPHIIVRETPANP